MTRRTWGLLTLLLVVTLVAVAMFVGLRKDLFHRAVPTPPPELNELAQVLPSPDASASSTADDGSPGTVLPVADQERAVRGQVVRPTGEPAPGARVVLMNQEGARLAEVVADAGGLFRIPDIDPGLYVVEASRDGFGPAVIVGVAPGPSPLRLVLHAGREVNGLVVSGQSPVPNAVVHIGGPGFFPQRAVQADASGRYRVSGLRAGRYAFVATAPGLGTGFGTSLTIDDADAIESLRLDLPLQRAPLVALDVVDRVTRQPVELAVITVASGPLHVLSIAVPAFSGLGIVDFLPRGEYTLRVRAPGYLPYTGPLRIGSQDAQATVELSPGARIHGRVTDEANNGLEGAAVTVIVETPAGARWEMDRARFEDFHRLARPDGTPFWVPASGFGTAADGSFAVSGIPSGRASVVVRAPGYATGVRSNLTLVEGERYDGVDFRLPRGRRIRGRIEDGAGGAVADAQVSHRPRDVPEWASRPTSITGANGVFDLQDVGANTRITVRHPEFQTLQVDVEVPENGLDDLVLRLAGETLPSIRGRLFTTQGASATGARIWFMAGARELPVCRATVGGDAWFQANQCTVLPERLIAVLPGYAPLLADLGGDLVERDWTLRVGGQLEVTNQRTPAVVSIAPSFQLPEALWDRPVIEIDRWSRGIVEGLAPGTYVISCASHGFQPQVISAQVVDGQRTRVDCPNLDRLMAIEIAVLDAVGSPLPEAIVLMDGGPEPIRAVSDARGRVTVELPSGTRLRVEALHEGWGRGTTSIYVPWETPGEPFRLPLTENVGGADPNVLLADLAEWGVRAVRDNRSLLVDRVDPGTPAAGSGLRRLDALLWARPVGDARYSIGLRRGGTLVTVELVREPR